MSKTNMKKANYTPLLDSLVDEYGITTAAVFGRVWRYCQMERGYCHAEQERIADELNISRRTVWTALQVLVRDGYLVDTTPNAKGRTRIYKDTGRAGIKRLPAAEVETEPVHEVVQEVVQEPVQNLLTKKVKKDKKEKKDNTTSVVQAFFQNATEEQKEAYRLVKRFSSEEKALEKANDDNPLEAARDFLEWCAEHGGKVAERVLEEIQEEEMRKEEAIEKEKVTNDLAAFFLQALRESGCTGDVTYGMYNVWESDCLAVEKTRGMFFYSDAIKENMKKYWKWLESGKQGDPEELNEQALKSCGVYV